MESTCNSSRKGLHAFLFEALSFLYQKPFRLFYIFSEHNAL